MKYVTPNDCNQILACKKCYDQGKASRFKVGITQHDEIVVWCEKHGLVYSADIIVTPEVKKMECPECGKPFDEAHHH